MVGPHHCYVGGLINEVFAVRPSLEPGWLEGILDGRVGLVPENYVEFIT